MTDFEGMLQSLNLTKTALAKAIRVQPGTIYRWKTDSDVPVVVVRYLQQQIELGKRGRR